MAELIVDIGSCWGDNYEDAAECVNMCIDSGVNKVKFQLCKAINGNKPIPIDYMPALVEYGNNEGASVSASIWDNSSMEFMAKSAYASWIKFAHSASKEHDLIKKATEIFYNVYVTVPLMSAYYNPEIVSLWTYEINGNPVYPVTCNINHTEMYTRYDGFSCHCLDMLEICYAIENGADVVEIHGNPLDIKGVPDAAFAFNLQQIEEIAKCF